MSIKVKRLESGREIAEYENSEILSSEISFALKSANASVFSAEKMLRSFVDGYGRIPDAPLFNALKVLRTDGSARLSGQRMTAKFAGSDAATGERYEANTEIFFINGKAIVAEPKSHPEWRK